MSFAFVDILPGILFLQRPPTQLAHTETYGEKVISCPVDIVNFVAGQVARMGRPKLHPEDFESDAASL